VNEMNEVAPLQAFGSGLTELEAIRLAVAEFGQESIPSHVSTLQAVGWLINEHREQVRHNDELGEENRALADERDALHAQLEATLRTSEFQIGDVVCWRGDRWFEGRIVCETAPEDKYLDTEVWDLEVTDPGTMYAGVDMTGRPVHVSEEALVLVRRDTAGPSPKAASEASQEEAQP
jgi:hypothetical protein